METGWGGAGMFDGWNGDWGWEFDGDQGLTPIEMAPVDFAFGPLGGSTDWSSWYGSFDDAGSSESGIMAEPPAPTPPVATPPPAVAAPAAVTLDTLEWPANAPFGHETEKSYELRTVTTTLTSGFDAYTLGMTAEATYLTDSSTFDGAAVVKGGGSVKFTFQKVTAGTPATPPDPIWDTWLVDTSAAGTAPVPAPAATGTPFASLLPAATTKWDKIEVAEHVTRLAHGLHNDRSVEYWYAAEDISNTRTVITPGATTADGVSAATVRISGDYSTRYGAGDWEAHANSVRQGTLWADNRSSGTFAQNQTVSTTFANGIAISQSVVGDGRLDGTDQTKVTLRSYSGKRIDDFNSLFGQVDLEIDTSGVTTGRNATDLKLAPVAGSAEWIVAEGTQSNSSEHKKTIVRDSLKVREDFQKFLPDVAGELQFYTITTSNTGYQQRETATTAGLLITKSNRVFQKLPATGTPVTDRMTESVSFDREELVAQTSRDKYWRRYNWNPSFGGIYDTEGLSESAFGISVHSIETSKSEIDFVTNSRTDTTEWERSGNDTRLLRDGGKSSELQTANGRTTEYLNASYLIGPSVSTGKVVSEHSPNPAFAALMGTTAMNSKITATTDSWAKLSGDVSVHEKSSGTFSFDVTTDKLTRFGPEDNTRTAKSTDLVIVNGIPQSGKIESKAVTLGSDLIVRTQKGIRRGSSDQMTETTETADLTDKWWGVTTVGTDETVTTYNAAVPTIDTFEMSGSVGASLRAGTLTIDQNMPSKSSAKTTWTPLLVHPELGTVTKTFHKSRQMIRTTVGGVSTFGDYRQSDERVSHETVARHTETDLAAQDGRTGKEIWDSKTEFYDNINHYEDRGAAAGVWNGLQITFNDFSDRTISGTHNKDLTVPAIGGAPTDETVTKVRDSVVRQYHSDRFEGSRGRGGDTATQKTTDFVNARLFTRIDGNLSNGMLTDTWDSTDLTTINTDNSHSYDWVNGARRLLSSTIEVTKNRDFFSHRHSTTPTYWYDSTTKTEYRYELAITGPVGNVKGMAKDYTHTTVFEKNLNDTGGRTIADTATGSPFRVAVAPMQIRWFDDTWVNAAWSLASDTAFGRGVSWTWNHGQDLARIGFGTFDVILGGSMVWTGVGTLPGFGLIAVGLDQIATGSINLRYGRVGQGFSIIEFGAYRATGSETAAFLAPGVLSLGFGAAGSLGRAGLRAGELGAATFGELSPNVRLTWQHFLPMAESRVANATAMYGSDALAMARAPRITPRWMPREITNPRYATGCEDVARQIQKLIGGDIKRILPHAGIPMLGEYRGHFPFWFHHEVVVRNGRVYDLFTGYKGLTASEFKQLWSSARWIEFGF